MKIKLEKNERLDDLLFNNLKIVQNKKLYCFSSDAVLLANFVKAKSNDNLLDLCSGSGIVGILAQAKTKAKHLTLVEIQKSMCDICNKTLQYNNLTSSAEVINCSVQDAPKLLGSEKYSIICCNPPYRLAKDHILNEKSEINVCKYEILLNLEDLIISASKLLKYGGKFFFIHDTARTAEILSLLIKHNLQPKILQFVFSKDKPSNVVLIQATKGGKSGLRVLKKEL